MSRLDEVRAKHVDGLKRVHIKQHVFHGEWN